MTISFYVGWVFLLASWTVPSFIKNKDKRHFVGAVLAAFATGIFVCDLINNFTK